MAKKKNIKSTAPNEVVTSRKRGEATKEDNMKSKVEIKQPDRHSQERMSRLVGSLFIGLGVLLVAFGIYSFIRFREEPVINLDLEAPVLTDVTSLTSDDTIVVRGSAPNYDSVFVYVEDEKVGETRTDDESNFVFEYTVEDEGVYELSVAGVRGFPNREMGPRSESRISVVDWTPPSEEDVTLTYGPETNRETFTLVGTSEPRSTVTVRRGTLSFSAVAGDDGSFRIEGIELEERRNVFTVSVRDAAGNEITLEERVRVEYNPLGDVNGDAVVDGDIPQASGVFDNLIANQLMMLFGVVALGVFGLSTTLAYKKRRA